jgi:hypothetical protein
MRAQWRNQWSIGVYAGPALDQLVNCYPDGRPAITSHDVTDVQARAVADPFLLRMDESWHLFFEVWNAQTARGEIGHATSPDGVVWQYRSIVLREAWHLSYPYVFIHDAAVWMVPESRQDEAVHLYVADRFPDRWRRVRTLVRGPFADASLVCRDRRWWMFALRGLDELCLWSADSLESSWTPHPASPLWPGNRSKTRPGGRLLDDRGVLVRTAQEAWPTYGHALSAYEVTSLTPSRYDEQPRHGNPILRATRHGWNAAAMHHLDAVRRADGSWLAVVDGATAAYY